MRAIIPAAGLGTRFLPATKAVPKEMLPVLNKPVIQYIVEEAGMAGASEVVIVNNPEKVAIEQHFSRNPELENHLRSIGKAAYASAVRDSASRASISFVHQEVPAGLGDAVLCGMQKTGEENFYVLLGDTIVLYPTILKRMQQVSNDHNGSSVIAVTPVEEDEVSRFGIIAGARIKEDVWKISSLVEKPAASDAPSNLAIFGRYLLTPGLRPLLEKGEIGAGGEVQLTDALQELLETESIYALVIDPEEGFDTGTVESWLETNIMFSKLVNQLDME